VVVNVGASRGSQIKRTLSICPQAVVFGFEPLPDNVSFLRQQWSNHENVHIHAMGIGANPGQMSINVGERAGASSFYTTTDFGNVTASFTRTVDRIKVDLTTLDIWYESLEQKMGKIDLLIIDVQGYEHPVILGGENVLSITRAIICETSLQPIYEGQLPYEEFILSLKQRDFEIASIEPGYVDRATGNLIELNVLCFKQ
jgi:FkbM family methyltransferase